MSASSSNRIVGFVILVSAGVAISACGEGSDATGEEPTVPVAVDGVCDDGLVESLSSWGSAGFNGVFAVDSPEDRCRVGVGLVAPGDPQPVDGATVFAIGSVSKAFTAAAILQLVADGTLSLDDPVGDHVDGLEGPVASASIESLLLHASGLVGSHGQDHSALSRDEAVAAIGRLDVDRSAQGRFLYSNAGYTLLALAVEGVAHVDFRGYSSAHVLPVGAGFWDGDPAPIGERALGLVGGEPTRQRGQFAGPHWALQGNGDLAMSVDSLAGWTRELFAGTVVPASALDLIERPTLEFDGQGVTAGWVVLPSERFGERMLATAGGGGDVGHDVAVAWLPETRRTVVVASSTEGVTAEELLAAVGAALVAGDDLPSPDTPIEVDRATLDGVAGEYELGPNDRFDVSVDGDSLIVVPIGPEAFDALDLTADEAPADVIAHERAVELLLAGRTGAGADEVALLEEDFGPLGDVLVLGSAVEERELRTYVELNFDASALIGWYALNSSGGIEGVDLGGPPDVGLVPTADGFRVRGMTASEHAVVVTFDDQAMIISSGTHSAVVAARS